MNDKEVKHLSQYSIEELTKELARRKNNLRDDFMDAVEKAYSYGLTTEEMREIIDNF